MKKQEYIKELERIRAGLKLLEGKISEIMGGLTAEVYKEAKKDACTVRAPQNEDYLKLLS